MRFDAPVYFQFIQRGAYDENTGNYAEPTIEETKQYASITDSGVETLNLIYGGIKQGCKTVRLQTPYKKPYSRMRIGDTLYRVDFARPLRSKAVFVVSEVQENVED